MSATSGTCTHINRLYSRQGWIKHNFRLAQEHIERLLHHQIVVYMRVWIQLLQGIDIWPQSSQYIYIYTFQFSKFGFNTRFIYNEIKQRIQHACTCNLYTFNNIKQINFNRTINKAQDKVDKSVVQEPRVYVYDQIVFYACGIVIGPLQTTMCIYILSFLLI